MARTTSIIRYKYKADRDFESVQFEGMSCPLGELRRLIMDKSTRSGSHHPKDDYDLLISDATTRREYRDPTEMIPRNTSVVVTRRMRGAFESLTPSTTPKPAISSDDIVNRYLRPAINHSSAVVEAINQPSNDNASSEELSEEERLKQILQSSRSGYLPTHRSNASHTCHHCKQPGHMIKHCPLLQSSAANAIGHANGSSSVPAEQSSRNDGTPRQPGPYPSHIVTNQAPYYHGHRGRHFRPEQMVRRPTGIPKDGLIAVPGPMPGVLRDKTGMSVVPKQMAQLLIENSEKKAEALAQRARQFQEKGVLPPAAPSPMLPAKSAGEEPPPEHLVCPICKQLFNDAVITPCCHHSFCDECIRNALIESEDHECPHCHSQHVPIDHINPNLFLRNHVNEWREERSHPLSYAYASAAPSTGAGNYAAAQRTEHSLDPASMKSAGLIDRQSSSESDEFDAAVLSTDSRQQRPAVPVKTAPIIIKMQPHGRSPSPQPAALASKGADRASEDDKSSDNDLKEKNLELPTANNTTGEESPDRFTDSNVSENEKSDRHTPPSQVAPVSAILSSPPTTTTTTMASSASVVPHYYPTHPHVPPVHHGLIYPHQMPSTSSAGLYPIPPNFYSPVMHVPYPGAPPGLPVNGMTHYPGHPPYPPMHAHHSIVPSHVNGYHLSPYESANLPALRHPNPAFANTSSSSMLPHRNQALLPPTLSKDQFYSQQRTLQQTQRSTSRRRSSSHSSHTSSASSFSRRADRHRRRPSRSRSRQRLETRRRNNHRTLSPPRPRRRRSARSPNKQRRSPAARRSPSRRTRARASPSAKEKPSAARRRASPLPPPPPAQRSTRDREQRRSPRPPPTIPQSTQRTIVYSSDSSSSKSHSNRDRHRSESRSGDRTAPSSKAEPHGPSEAIQSTSPLKVPSNQRHVTLSSIITPVAEKASSKRSTQAKAVESSNGDRKRRKHRPQEQGKHARPRSSSPHTRERKVRDSHEDEEESNIVVENSTSDSRRVIEAQ